MREYIAFELPIRNAKEHCSSQREIVSDGNMYPQREIQSTENDKYVTKYIFKYSLFFTSVIKGKLSKNGNEV